VLAAQLPGPGLTTPEPNKSLKLKEVSRHRSTDVLASYIRDAHIFKDYAGDGFL